MHGGNVTPLEVRGFPTMTRDLRAAHRDVLKIAGELEAITLRLRGVQAGLPEPVEEVVRLLDIERLDPTAELRAVIDCVIGDQLVQAIRDLRNAAKETGEG
jgi:hypothetical protein